MNYFYPYQDFRTFPYYAPPLYSNPYLDMRGSWTPFSWVEKYRYAFSGPYHKAEIALTFDDGPDLTFTPQILNKLKAYNVKATFFLLGENMAKYPELVKQIALEGHVIGNHTYTHPNLTQISDAEFYEQIQRVDALTELLVGYKPRFFRPTYGAINENQVAWATEQQMMVIQWSIDTLDWKGLDATTIANTVMANVLPGSIILQHNADGVPLQGSVEALDQMIPVLQQKGAKFVTLPEMFGLTKEK